MTPDEAVPELVLHAGLHHAGAPMLQRAFARLRPQLHARHVAVVDLPARHDVTGLRAVFTEARRECVAASGSCRAVLVSGGRLLHAPGLDGGGAEDRVGAVIAASGAGSARVVLVVRRQDRLLETAYLDAVHAGGHARFEDMFGSPVESPLDFGLLAERLARVASVRDVAVIPFELVHAGPAAFVDHLLLAAGLPGGLDLRPLRTLKPQRVYSGEGLRLALAMNPLLDTMAERRLVHRFLLEHYEAVDDRDSRVLTGSRAAILDAHREVNAKFLRAWCPELPEDGYADDAGTATLSAALAPVVWPTPSSARRLARSLQRRVGRRR